MNRIKKTRIEKGLTVEQLAHDIGISVEEMIAYENMPVDELRQFFSLPNLCFDEIFG